MRRENYDDEEEDNNGRVRWDSRGDPPPFWDDNNDNDHDTDNDADVEGVCFQPMHTRHRCRAQAVLALQPHDGGGERLFCNEDIYDEGRRGIQHNDNDNDNEDNDDNDDNGDKGPAATS